MLWSALKWIRPRYSEPTPLCTRRATKYANDRPPLGVRLATAAEPTPMLVENSDVSPCGSVAVAVKASPALTPLMATRAWPVLSATPEPTNVLPWPAGVIEPDAAAGASATKTSTVHLAQVETL